MAMTISRENLGGLNERVLRIILLVYFSFGGSVIGYFTFTSKVVPAGAP